MCFAPIVAALIGIGVGSLYGWQFGLIAAGATCLFMWAIIWIAHAVHRR